MRIIHFIQVGKLDIDLQFLREFWMPGTSSWDWLSVAIWGMRPAVDTLRIGGLEQGCQSLHQQAVYTVGPQLSVWSWQQSNIKFYMNFLEIV